MINKSKQFNCIDCDYTTYRKSNYDKHLQTSKHIIKTYNKPLENLFVCDRCEKLYKTRMGLWHHTKVCISVSEDVSVNKLIAQNNKLLEHNQELTDKIVTICKTISPNIVNNMNTNTTNTFNLNIFLNETCKDAMSISDFVSSIKPGLADLENTGSSGYVLGISSLILKHLKDIESTKRPIHCSDLKREVMYVKDDNMWFKEDEERPKLSSAIRAIAHKNIKNINEWRYNNPKCNDISSNINDMYLNIVSNSMSGSSADECNKNMDKIISNIAKEVVVSK